MRGNVVAEKISFAAALGLSLKRKRKTIGTEG
jgi:hypothetical protein